MASTAVRPPDNTPISASDLSTTQQLIAIDIIGDAVSWPHANLLLRALARLSVSTSKLELIALILHIDAPNRAVTISLLDTLPIPAALVKHLQSIWTQLAAISLASPSYAQLAAIPADLSPTSPVSAPRLAVTTAVYTYSARALLARFEAWMPLLRAFSGAASAKYAVLVGLSALIEAFAAGPTTLDGIRAGTDARWTALQTFLRGVPAAEWLLRECAVWAAELDPAEPGIAEAQLNFGILPRLRRFAGVLQSRAYTLGELAAVVDALDGIHGMLRELVAGAGTDVATRMVNTFDWVVAAWAELREECVAVAEDFVVADWDAWSALGASPLLATMRLPQVDPDAEPTRPVHFPIDIAMGNFLTQHTHVANLLKAATASGLRPLFAADTTIVAMGEMEPVPVTKVRAEGESIAVLYVSEDAPERTY